MFISNKTVVINKLNEIMNNMKLFGLGKIKKLFLKKTRRFLFFELQLIVNCNPVDCHSNVDANRR